MKANACKTRGLTALVFSMLFLFASCDAQTPVNVLTPTPMPTRQPASAVQVSQETALPDITQKAEETARQSFEKLRQAALDASEGKNALQAEVIKFLINYSNDTMILALPISIPDMESDINDEDESAKRYHVMEVALAEYKLYANNLIEWEYSTVPILVKTEKGTAVIQEISIPDFHDYQAQQQEILDIFGVESEEELGLWPCDEETKNSICRAYKKRICSLKSQIAAAGGFDGFVNGTVGIFNEIRESGYFDNSTEEGAIREHFLETHFSYNMITVPYWHELLRETENGETTLYLAMYIGHIYAMEDGTLMTGASSSVGKIKLGFSDGIYYVSEYEEFQGDGEQWLPKIEEYMGECSDAYLDFRETEEYEDLIFNGECLLDSIIDGTFVPEEHGIN